MGGFQDPPGRTNTLEDDLPFDIRPAGIPQISIIVGDHDGLLESREYGVEVYGSLVY